MFSNRLKSLRQAQGDTQVQLSDKLGVSKQSVSNWENENILPSIEMLMKIANLFGVTTDYLLDFEKRTNGRVIDVSDLTEEQIYHLESIVEDLKKTFKP